MSTVEGRFNQQPEDFILDEFHLACLSLQEDDADLEYLYVCGNYSSNFIGGSVRFEVDDNNC